MNSIIIKLKSLLNGVWGEIIKIACNFNIIKPLYTIGDYSNNEKKIIVTLTSYGRRVSSILHYTIIQDFYLIFLQPPLHLLYSYIKQLQLLYKYNYKEVRLLSL